MRKFFIACFVFLTVEAAFSATSPWQCSGVIADEGRIALSGDFAAVGNSEWIDFYRRQNYGWTSHERIDCPDPSNPSYYFFCESLSLDNEVCAVGVPNWVGPLVDFGQVLIYRLENDSWKLKETVSEPNRYVFGEDVSVSNDVLAVTSWCDNYDECGNIISVYLYRFDGQNWALEQTIADADGGIVKGDLFATLKYVAEDGGGMVKLCIYRFDGAQWLEEKVFDYPHDIYRYEYAFSGDRLAVVIDDVDSSQAGRKVVCIYVFDGVDWVQEAKLKPPVYNPESYFGSEVAISDCICVVGSGSPWVEEEGEDFVYELIDDEWVLTARFDKWTFEPWDIGVMSFKHRIACDGEHILAHAYYYNYAPVIISFDKCPAMDLDGDCFVTVADLQMIAEQWLTGHR